MGKTLIVAEKPSVGQDLASTLPGSFKKNEGYLESDSHIVSWAVGHLVRLAEPDEYDERYKKWRMADLPILPTEFKLKPADSRSGKQLSVVQKLMRRPDIDRVINACDAGREGELIFAYIWQTAHVKRPVERLWISSLTQQAIRAGLSHLRPAGDMARLEEAARSRSEADWLIGMNATRAATIRGRAALGGVVSLGRVQTPTLAILAGREAEIQAFVPEDYWLVEAAFEPAASARYAGLWFAGDQTRLKTVEQAEAIVAKVRGKPGAVASVERREQTEVPPLLYDLTSLQRDANHRFSFSAARTLRAAQSLYEDKKALTYPRTSSRYLSTDMIPQLKPTAETLAPIGEYSPHARYVLGLEALPLRRVVDDSKIGDHHAIIPTIATHAVEKFSADEQRVFDLVARRYLAVFHPPARYARTMVITEIESERFRTRGRVTIELGWRGVYGALPDETEQPRGDEEERGELPPLHPGQHVRCVEAESEKRTTRPPARYNEATLLSAMETAGTLVDNEALREAMKNRGLGTPATRAEIIETLIRREYIERNGKELTPTPKGMQVIALLDTHPLTSPELTGDWEKRLNEMEAGRVDRPTFMHGVVDFTRQTVELLASLAPGDVRPERVELGLCPRCGAQTGSVIRENSKGYGCTSWKSQDEPGCGFVIWKKVAGRTLTPEVARQLLEHGRTNEVLAGFKSRAGKPFRARLLLAGDGRVTFDMPPRPGGEPAPAEGDPDRVPKQGSAVRNGAAAPQAPDGNSVATDGRGLKATEAASSRSRQTTTNPPAANGVTAIRIAPPSDGVDPAVYLRQAGLEVIDKRPAGALWVVDGQPPSPALAALRAHGIRFVFARNGGRSTGHRPAWFAR
jgi:DNA topoisomerase-3